MINAVTRNEVIRLCGYISNDATIAAYLDVDRRDVARIRKRIPKHRPRGLAADAKVASVFVDVDAIQGSSALRDRMMKLYAREAKRTKVSIEHAMARLLYGDAAVARWAA